MTMMGSDGMRLDPFKAWTITVISSVLALVTRYAGGMIPDRRSRDGAQIEKGRARVMGRCIYSIDRWLVSCCARSIKCILGCRIK